LEVLINIHTREGMNGVLP